MPNARQRDSVVPDLVALARQAFASPRANDSTRPFGPYARQSSDPSSWPASVRAAACSAIARHDDTSIAREPRAYDGHVPGGTEALVVAGQEALVARDWARARRSFEVALEQEETAAALNGLGIALGWLDDVEASLRYRERAYARFRRSDPLQAAVIAMQLCSQYASSLGNLAASRGWLGRFERLVEQFELPAVMEAWVLLCRASLASASNDPHAAQGYGREALEIARRYPGAPGPDAELCALCEIGAALVELGRVEEGTALLDEAMAASLAGEDESPETVVYTSCKTVVACARAAEVRRATR